MLKIIFLVAIIGLIPEVSKASEEDSTMAKTLLSKITSLQVFKLRLPQQFQREVQAEILQTPNTNTPDTCQLQAKPHHRGAGIEYVCDPKKNLKAELAAIASN